MVNSTPRDGARCPPVLDTVWMIIRRISSPSLISLVHGLHVTGAFGGGEDGKKILQGLRGHCSS